MIRQVRGLWPRPRALVQLTALHVVAALLHGLLLALLVPLFRALLGTDPDFSAATPWLMAGGIGAVLYVGVSLATSPVTFAATTALSAQLRHRLMRHATSLPVNWFDTENKGRLSRTVTTAAIAVTHLAVLFGPTVITGTIVPAIVIAVAFVVEWRIAVVLLIVAPLAYLTRRRGTRITAQADIALERVAEEIAMRAIELSRAQPVLRATGRAATGTAAMAAAITEHERTYRSGMRQVQTPDLLFRILLATGLLAALVVGTWLMLAGRLAVPDALALFVLTVRFVETLGEVGALAPVLNAADRVWRILDQRPLPRTADPVRLITSGDIDLTDVGFSYGTAPALTPALSGVTVRFPAGTTTALVGPSGSGKSTLVNLIARFADVDTGSVRIGGTDVRDIDPDVVMRAISVVFQDVYLFDDTIEANVRLARPEATPEELADAAVAARLDEVVERLPAGWQTQVGEAGAQLSGGERQRVSIARALLKDSRVVLVDEAASALDPINEAAIGQAIGALAARSRTVIVIAHRPATLATADRVVVLDSGRVVQTGTPDELLAADGPFAHLYHQHERARAWHIATPPEQENRTSC